MCLNNYLLFECNIVMYIFSKICFHFEISIPFKYYFVFITFRFEFLYDLSIFLNYLEALHKIYQKTQNYITKIKQRITIRKQIKILNKCEIFRISELQYEFVILT